MKPVDKRKAVVLSAVALFLVGVLWVATRGKPRYAMPVHGGKTAEEWFFGSRGHPGLERTVKDARVVFEAMGTNCIPFLMGKAKTRESTFNRFYCRLHPKLPTWMQTKLGTPLKATYIKMLAYSYLRDLEPKADFMADEILASVKLINDDGTRYQAFQSVEGMAVRRLGIEKKKAYFLSFLADSDFEIQLESAIMLSRVDNKLTNGLAILARVATNRTVLAQAITSRFPARMPSESLKIFIRLKQESADEALRLVSPAMAERLQLNEIDETTTNNSELFRLRVK